MGVMGLSVGSYSVLAPWSPSFLPTLYTCTATLFLLSRERPGVAQADVLSFGALNGSVHVYLCTQREEIVEQGMQTQWANHCILLVD